MSVPVVPFIPDTAPFTAEQRAWLNGYLAALFSPASAAHHGALAPQTEAPPVAHTVTILYGSQTGTAEGVAREVADHAVAQGLQATVCDMADYDPAQLAAAELLLLVCSTYGDGDMPDTAQSFWDYLCGAEAPRLQHVQFSVLALGDTNYETFCQAGKNLDERLEALGAKRMYPRVDCDVDYEDALGTWVSGVLPLCTNAAHPAPVASVAAVVPRLDTPAMVYARKSTYRVRMLTNRVLTAPHSSKETRHYEIALDGSGLSYTVGDALGVIPTNCPALVQDMLDALGCRGNEAVSGADGDLVPLRQALLQHYDITLPSKALVDFFAERSGDLELQNLLKPENKKTLERFLWGRESIDFLLIFSHVKPSLAEFIGLLKRLQPRAYSISSSLKAHPHEVHLTVASVRYESYGRARKGVCSTFLADRVGLDTDIPVFLQPNKNFGVPQDHDRPMIMVGPGTGVAPFRAFLEERRAVGAMGKNWLFFGERNSATDFFYKDQLLAYAKEGFLTHLDLAFSRDQQEKHYVQHRMLENSKKLYDWLEDGAYVFVCGDMYRMAKDVDETLHLIIAKERGCSSDNAVAYVAQLRREKRYVRDVY